MTQVLVPLKDLVQAKTRLAGLLRPSERRSLAQAMLQDVLQVLTSHPQLGRITLVSDDPSSPLLAQHFGLAHIRESELGCRGLNAVVAAASARLLADSTEPLLVMHADLPLLGARDISAVLAAREDIRGLVLGCDRAGSGTNLLAFDRHSLPRFCFGTDSCAAHLAAARADGIATRVVRRPGIALDVDEPGDLARLLIALEAGREGPTAELLCGTALGARLRVALASLAPGNGLHTGGESG